MKGKNKADTAPLDKFGYIQPGWFYTILIMKFSPDQVKLFNFQEDSKKCFIDIMTFATGNYF